MNERRDDTPETPDAARRVRERAPKRGYYYDDTTGYEVYKPEEDEETDQPEGDEPKRCPK